MLVTIATFSFPHEVHLAKAQLDAFGIPSFIPDEHTINVTTGIFGDALGSIRLQVPKEFATQALEALNEPYEIASTPESETAYDPFGASIDQAHAISSIGSSRKPWVRKTFFVLFVVGPLVCAELFALAMALSGLNAWGAFFLSNIILVPIWLIYFSIWRRKVKRPKYEETNGNA